MQLNDIRQSNLKCPACLGELKHNQCKECGTAFPETLGIIDLRWPPVQPGKEDEQIVPQLLRQFDKVSFAQLIKLRFQHTSAPREYLDLYQKYQSTMYDRGYTMIKMFRKRLDTFFKVPDNFLALDLGCGVGTSSAELASQFKWVVAIDPSLPHFVLRKQHFAAK